MQRRTVQHDAGFTLVEILIVVIILGILAAIVIPQFTNASTDAKNASAISQLQTLRSAIQLYRAQHLDVAPRLITGGSGEWDVFTKKSDMNGNVYASGSMAGFDFGPYIPTVPINSLNGQSKVAATTANGVGWIYNESNGELSMTDATYAAMTY